MGKRRFVGFKVCHALIARVLFASHSLLSIFQLYRDTNNLYFLAIVLVPACLFIEAAITILSRHGDEYKWFCPSIFIFLCGSVPPIWLLEVGETNRALSQANYSFIQSLEEVLHSGIDESQPIEFAGLKIHIPHIKVEWWRPVLEQALLVILVIGRWLLPKGSLTRDELSQLLLAYLAISSDIVELFNLFSHREVRTSLELTVILLGMWSVSLIQFPMVLTTMKGQKTRYCWPSTRQVIRANQHLPASRTQSNGSVGFTEEFRLSSRSSRWARSSRRKSAMERMADLSVWGILSTVALQDGPFLCFRLYMIVWKNIRSYTLYFFVAKNSLITAVQIYRLLVLCCDSKSMGESTKEEDTPMMPIAENLPENNGAVEATTLAVLENPKNRPRTLAAVTVELNRVRRRSQTLPPNLKQ